MFRGSADEAVVIVKRHAEEDMVTCQRRNHAERDREVEGEGRNMTLNDRSPQILANRGSAEGNRKSTETYASEQRRTEMDNRRAHRRNVEQLTLFTGTENLYEELCGTEMLKQGFKAVKRNGGSAGVDGQRIADFDKRLDEEIERLKSELTSWSYQPQPVRRVEIPKPGGAGVRLLGVPTVRDRVVQATVQLLLEPIFDPEFSKSSYGFRPGRSQRDAVESARRIVSRGKEYVVDIDLSKFFDRVNHDRLIERMKGKVKDKRMLRLVGMTLRSGVMVEGVVNPTEEGTTQGSPLSPLLSNIVLDELDKELERRELEFCRYADDCNIFTGSAKAAERVMKSVQHFIETRLRLVVNEEKSKVGRCELVKFLGMTVVAGTIAISAISMKRAKERAKELTPRRTHLTIEASIEEISRWYRGWSEYFKMTNYPAQLHHIEAYMRRRLRARLVCQMKRPRTIMRKLIERGVRREGAFRAAYSGRKVWSMSHVGQVDRAYPNDWFERKGLYICSNRKLPHWKNRTEWITMT